MNLIIERLVRNNGWVIQRYAPKSIRQREQEEMLARYERIALNENASDGYALGMAELLETIDQQPDRERIRVHRLDEPDDPSGLRTLQGAAGSDALGMRVSLLEASPSHSPPDRDRRRSSGKAAHWNMEAPLAGEMRGGG